jgi:putative FmdB family regulatory protein
MPTYGYKCKSCGFTFDVIQDILDDPIKTCPKCGKDVRRLITGGSGIIFKGSGFYCTDSRHGSAVMETTAKPKESAKQEAAPAKSEAPKSASPAAKSAPQAASG